MTDTTTPTAPAETPAKADQHYRVLARKYRPTNFDALIGQDALVRTLSNAIATGRIAHAFVLTGIRGIGKTTTARIIARALNCVGADGKGGPTVQPCGVCEHCTSIAADRHVDVLEMDAASRTGVDSMREIIETVQYKPVSARYKVYIIDEVHMLSTSAFNALLKTLEEPPAHVKFIFATTELRKIPVTVLSRCQRFDLKRIEGAQLQQHLAHICAKEGVKAEDEALALVARAAEGSVRDALSLLDQAIAHADEGAGVTATQVQQMVGQADRSKLFTLLETLLQGDIATALETVAVLYHEGGDPSLLLGDLLDITHFISRVQISSSIADDPAIPHDEREAGKKLANTLTMPVLTRSWQVLMKGVQELKHAPHPMQALEMVLIRLAYMAELPTPEQFIRQSKQTIGSSASTKANAPAAASAPRAGTPAPAASHAATPAPASPSVSAPAPVSGDVLAFQKPAMAASAPTSQRAQGAHALALAPQAVEEPVVIPLSQTENTADTLSGDETFDDFEALVERFAAGKELILYQQLRQQVRLVSFSPCKLTLHPLSNLSVDFSSRIQHCLKHWTGQHWSVVLETDPSHAEPTLAEQEAHAWEQKKQHYATKPELAPWVQAFPGAEILSISPIDSNDNT